MRYTPEGGHVRVGVSAQEKQALLEVVDDGPGVGPAELGRLGERFHRLAGQEHGGSGLGLSIVQRIAQLHGGSVRYAAAPGGKGLAVTVLLPPAARASG